MNRNMRYGGHGGGPYGPLATDHIRNLNDELESLKRRRDLLQREQELLAAEKMYSRKRQYQNSQPLRKFDIYEMQQTQNFSHLYDNGPGPSFNRGGPQPIKKRPTVNVWDNPNSNLDNQIYRPYVSPKPQVLSAPKPLMSVVPKPSIGRRISGFPSQPVRKNFTPNKVTKPARPTKFNTEKTTKPTPGILKPLTKADKPLTDATKGFDVLRADRVPSTQMTGRLELALGAILKEMKDYCTNDESLKLFHSRHIQRSIKQSIRERLRTVMLNKVVGRYVDIVATYRETYPADTDKEIVEKAILSTDSAHRQIRHNIHKLLTKKLDEMFSKLQQLYEGKQEEVIKIIESSSNNKDDKEQEKTEKSNNVNIEFYSSLVESMLEAKLPMLLPKFINKIVKILEQDEEVQKKLQFKGRGEQSNKPKEQSVAIEINDNETENDVTEVKEADTKEASLEEITSDDKVNKDIEIGQSKNNDTTHETSLIIDKTESAEKIANKETKVQQSEETQKNKLPVPVAQYFVKVIGQPSLPNRNDAYNFLNQFNAVSIKKHKIVPNLLVVAFNTEKDFENAIGASGTAVGNSTFIIKANDKLQQNIIPSSKDKEITNSNEPPKNILSAELENQRTNLLTSIRKESQSEIKTDLSNDSKICQPSNIVDKNEIKKENVAIGNSKEDNEMLEGTLQSNVYSPTNAYDEDSQGLGTIQEKNFKIENEEESTKSTIEGQIQSDGNNKEVGKGTPVRTSSRLTNVTASSIRTRRASRLAQNN